VNKSKKTGGVCVHRLGPLSPCLVKEQNLGKKTEEKPEVRRTAPLLPSLPPSLRPYP